MNIAVLFSGFYSFFFFGLFTSENLFGLLDCIRRPFSLGLHLLEMVKLFDADNGSAFREPVAAHEGAFLTLPDDQLAGFAFMAFNAGRFGGRLRGQNIAFLVQF